uniref:Uncharacterized protein n=1 Tax=Aegilops tauschii subsp. strangulata TaxID=200361 RepID=A0A453RLP9_AEGTS
LAAAATINANLQRWRSSLTRATKGTPAGRYTSDTHEGPADRKNKKAMVDESPPPTHVPNQWVAFCTDHSWSQRVHGVLLHLNDTGIAALLRDYHWAASSSPWCSSNCTKRSVISIGATQLRPEMMEGSAQEDVSLDNHQVFSVLCYCMNRLLAREVPHTTRNIQRIRSVCVTRHPSHRSR